MAGSPLLLLRKKNLVAPYTGQVATACRCPTERVAAATNAQSLCRTLHKATQNITSLQLMYVAWSIIQGVETGAGANVTYSASIEYPLGTLAAPGTRTRVTFGGSNDGVCVSSFRIASDAAAVAIPKGAMFAVWTFARVASGNLPYLVASTPHLANEGNGGGYLAAASGLTDVCTSGTFVSGNPDRALGPIAIIAPTRRRSVMILVDSRGFGSTDTFDTSPDLGSIAKALGAAGVPYISMGSVGNRMGDWTVDHSRQDDFHTWISDVLVQFGINDVSAGVALATQQTRFQNLKNLLVGQGKRMSACTIPPITTGAWTLADRSDQSLTANEALRADFNTWLRAGSLGVPIHDIAQSVEAADGKWLADGTASKYTADGTHQTPFAFAQERASGGIKTKLYAP